MWYVTIAVLLAETTFYLIFASGEEQSWNKKVILKEKYRFYESKRQTVSVQGFLLHPHPYCTHVCGCTCVDVQMLDSNKRDLDAWLHLLYYYFLVLEQKAHHYHVITKWRAPWGKTTRERTKGILGNKFSDYYLNPAINLVFFMRKNIWNKVDEIK